MSLEGAFKRLALRPTALCRQCQRAFSSTPASAAPAQSATQGMAASVQASRDQNTAQQQTRNASPQETAAAPARSAYDIAGDHIRETNARSREQQQAALAQHVERNYSRADLERQLPRKFQPGDVYAPHDLTGVEMAKWKKLRKKGRPKADVFDQLGINPIHHYKNFAMMSEYMTDMGRIRHRRETSLRPVNQRRVAKAIRRAVGLGLMPGVHRHPEILKLDQPRR